MIRLSSWVMLQRLPPKHLMMLQSPTKRIFSMVSSVTLAGGSHRLWMNPVATDTVCHSLRRTRQVDWKQGVSERG